MAVGGVPARWWPIFTNTYLACGMAAFGGLLSVLCILVALLGDFDAWMLPMVVASLLAVCAPRVSVPVVVCGICRAFRVSRHIPV